MGYWATTTDGRSFAKESELLWGDSPADAMDECLRKACNFIRDEFGKVEKKFLELCLYQSLLNYDDNMNKINLEEEYGGRIFNEGVENMVNVFEKDVGRKPKKEEIVAGFHFSTSIYDENMEKQA